VKRGLFAKYVTLLVGLVAVVLALNAALDLYFVYQDNRRSSIEVQHEKADAAAQRIELFVREIERQIGWVAHAQWADLPVETRRFDYARLLRQVPAITELVQIDRQGREQLRESRLGMNVVGGGTDRSAEPAFVETMANRVYFSPVYFRKESEPYLTMAVAHGRRSGVTVADVNLKLIWDVVSKIKIGETGYAYVVDRQGRLIAHPDISLVLRGTDMSRLPQVAEALHPKPGAARDIDARNLAGVAVLSAHASIPALNWLVFVELPDAEALQPVFDTALRDFVLLILSLLIAGLAAALLARRMVVPIRAMQEGAQRIGSGDLSHRLSIKTGDELEALADQFNRSAGALRESYETLEQHVEDRTRELSETLDQQTATAEVLQVISRSPTDVQPVFDVIADSALKLLNGWSVVVWRVDGDRLRAESIRGGRPASNDSVRQMLNDPGIARLSFVADAARTGQITQIVDAEAEGVPVAVRDIARLRGWRSNIAVPMVSESRSIGLFSVSRVAPGPFDEREVRLLQTFADQAVIAIQNVRLFTELRESLEQQTATASVLKVISESPTDVQPVLDVVAASARRFCGANDVVIALRQGDGMTITTHDGPLGSQVGDNEPLDRTRLTGRAILDGRTVHLPDIAQADHAQFARAQEFARAHAYGSALVAPMLREGRTVGAILLRKIEVGPFTGRQIELLETFAAQAVIAIQNVRLFTELRESLEQQTAISDVLKVMSRSTFDLEPLLLTVIEAAANLCRAQMGGVFQLEADGAFHWKAGYALDPSYQEHEQSTPLYPGEDTLVGRVALRAAPVTELDALADPNYGPKAMATVGSVRSMLGVPMLRDGKLFGVICMARDRVEAFTDKQVELVRVFADQAVIAIENVRLLNEIRDKSRQLEVASQHKSQFLANMSHELRTPLNAILGYTEMMVDGLYGEMPGKAQGVLERVQSNGKHLLGLINDVLDLSKIEAGQLTLAVEEYSVADMVATVLSATESLARAKGLALEKSVPADLPLGIGDSRRLTQVLLNLVGNAIKFTDQGKVEVRAARLGERFEISVVDTGPGIAPADQAKIFEEFQQVDNSSTRQKGGTGLGLSISRKIVELHGGRIVVQSAVGHGSTFTVAIPIDAAPVKEAAQ